MRNALTVLVLILLVAAPAGATAAGPDASVVFDADRAVVHAAPAGGSLLTGEPGATADATATAFLRANGRDAAIVDSLVVTNSFAIHGVTHVRFGQQVGGLRVAGAYVRAAVDPRGRLLHVVDNLVPVRGAVLRGAVAAEQALDAALARVHPKTAERPGVARRKANVTTFGRTPFFAAAPRAERVLVARESGSLEQGFLVETWSRAGNLLHETLIDRDGRVAAVELRTARDSYNVFAEDPDKNPQASAPGAGAGSAESPAGWLSGSQLTTHINGNNASTYLDVDANNVADAGGTSVTNGSFTAAASLTQPPSTTVNRAVGVQNLFYLNNRVHDILYRHGFTEAAGNFQANNFGKGGLGSDPVNAEVQDGSGTDNANFATPSDGSRPRMQMYLWTGKGPTHEVVVGSTVYGARDAGFGPAFTTTGVTGKLTLVNDRTATTTDACEPLARNSLRRAIALIDRGTCSFVIKVKNAQNAGALGAIVANHNVGEEPFRMGGEDATITIPSLMVSKADGDALKGRVGSTTTIRRKALGPLQRDSSLDSDIVYHEYGHGLTTRMIGGMGGPLSGAIGEGASDTLAFLINGDDRIGEYSASNTTGIRSAPYAVHAKTYGQVTGAGVHSDGEIYAAIMWDLQADYSAAGLSPDAVFLTWVDGMNYTPSSPAYEDMREGMLSSAAARGKAAERCLIWRSFAQRGVGDGADGTVSGTTVSIRESFAVPTGC
jgi:hypothetical protein